MAKKIELKFDFDSKDVEIVSDKVLTLTEQMRILKKELQKTSETSPEFDILKTKFNETKDSVERVNVKSRELFGTFSLIPGPIGEISSKIDGTISLLKVFSGFSLKDIKNSFVDLGSDIAGIAKGFADATGLTKLFGISTTLVSKGLKLVGIEATAASLGVRAFTGALLATGIGAIVFALGSLVSAFMAAGDETDAYTEKVNRLNEAIEAQKIAINRRNREELAAAKARGASEKEQFDIRRRQQEDEIARTKEIAKEREMDYFDAAVLYGEDSEQFKQAAKDKKQADQDFEDAKSDLRVLDFAEEERLAKDKLQLQNETNQKKKQLLERDREERLREAEVDIQIEKDKSNTDAKILQELILKKWRITMEGKKVTKKEEEAAIARARQESEQEIQKDIEARQAANEKILQGIRDTNALIISDAEITYERKKALYGDDAQAAIDAERAVIMSKDQAAEQEIEQFNKLITAGQVLSSEQQKRLTEVKNSRQTYTTQLISLTNQEIEINREKNLKINDGDEEALQQTADNADLAASIRIDALKRLMQQVEIDKNFELESLNQRAELLRKNGETEIAIAAFVAEQKKLIEEGYAQKVKPLISGISDLTQQKNEESFQSFLKLGTAIGSASQLFDEGSRAAKTFSDIQELVNIANQAAIIITNLKTLGIIKETAASAAAIPVKTAEAAADGTKGAAKVPFPGSLIAIAAIIGAMVAVFASIKKIAGQKTTPPSPNAPTTTQQSGPINVVATRASGGPVYGPGTSRSDSIPTMLSNGEFVVNARSAAMFSPLLTRLNAIGNQPRFASAGMDMSSLSSNNMNLLGNTPLTEMLSRPIKTYVTAVDMSNQQQFERTIKSRSLL